MKKQIAIFDLDSTLFNCDHRLRGPDEEPVDFDTYYKGILQDTANMAVLTLAELLHHNGHEIVFITERPESTRNKTVTMLRLFGDATDYRLLMRMNGDNRPEHEIKESHLLSMLKAGEKVLCAFDDRPSVLDIYKKYNIYVFDTSRNSKF